MYSDTIQFSAREKEVINLLLQGKSNKQIALALSISASTVEYHLKNIYKKLQVSSRTEAVLRLGKSIGNDITRELGKSTVEINGEPTDNGNKSISTQRIPMNKMFTIVGGGLLTTALIVIIALVKMPAQNAGVAPTTQASSTPAYTPESTLTQADFSTSIPVINETSLQPFEYVVMPGDTCESIAAAFNVLVEAIRIRNDLPSSCPLADGQILLIPYSNVSLSNPNEESNNPPAEFYGEWVNVDLKNANMTRVSIQAVDGATYTYINMFGACSPTDCDFREYSPTPVVNYNYDSETGILSVKWTFDFETLTQEIILTSDGQLKITTQNHYLDNSGRADFKTVEYFTRQ